MFKEELLITILKFKERKRRNYFKINEIIRYILYQHNGVSITTIIHKIRELEKQGFIRRMRHLKYGKSLWGFPVYENVYFINELKIKAFLRRLMKHDTMLKEEIAKVIL